MCLYQYEDDPEPFERIPVPAEAPRTTVLPGSVTASTLCGRAAGHPAPATRTAAPPLTVVVPAKTVQPGTWRDALRPTPTRCA